MAPNRRRHAAHDEEHWMYVSDYTTTKDLLVASPKDSARDVFYQMRARDLRHVPVVANGELVGLLSDRELRRPRWIEDTPDLIPFYDLASLHCEDVMEPKVVSLRAHDDIGKAVALFTERRYGAAPVLDKHGKLYGMISVVDVLAAFRDHLVRSEEDRVTKR